MSFVRRYHVLMKIAILSDSHGDELMVTAALRLLQKMNHAALLHCGDVGEPGTIALFAGETAHFVIGNCDHSEERMRQAAEDLGLAWHGAFADLRLGGKRIALLHGDDHRRLNEAIHSGTYDYVCHGHTHVPRHERIGKTTVINPGALHRARPKTMAILDLTGGQLNQIIVAE